MGYNIITGGAPLVNTTWETFDKGFVREGTYARRRPGDWPGKPTQRFSPGATGAQ